MRASDLRILCTALGFLAVVMKGGEEQPDCARRAVELADLMEGFCTYTMRERKRTGRTPYNNGPPLNKGIKEI